MEPKELLNKYIKRKTKYHPKTLEKSEVYIAAYWAVRDAYWEDREQYTPAKLLVSYLRWAKDVKAPLESIVRKDNGFYYQTEDGDEDFVSDTTILYWVMRNFLLTEI